MTGTRTPNRTRHAQPDSRDAVSHGAPPAAGLTRWSAASPDVRFAVLAGLVLGLALVVRVGYVLHTSNYVPLVDAGSYNLLGVGLAKGHDWVYGSSAYIAPGFPFFLGGVYTVIGLPLGHWTDVRIVQAVIATGTVALIGVLGLQLIGRRVALVAMTIAAVYVPLVLVGDALITESLFVPLVLAATNCALRSRVTEGRRYRWIIAAGVFAGLASLTRGNGLVLAPALACVVWTSRPRWSRRALAAPVTLVIVTALTISPWTIRNAIADHQFVPVTTEAGLTLAGTYNQLSARTRYIWQLRYSDPSYLAIKQNKRLNDAQRDTQLISAVGTYVSHHPLAVPEAMFWNTLRLLDLQGRRVSRMTARTDTRATAGWADLAVVVFWVVAALAIIGLFTRGVRAVPRVVWLVPLFLYLSVAPVTTGTPRFRAALDPFVILVAAAAIASVAEVVRERRVARRRRWQPPLPAPDTLPAR
jgi:4-amino-4-deoxy-L-arabinose transferase-like glycosyltransferase